MPHDLQYRLGAALAVEILTPSTCTGERPATIPPHSHKQPATESPSVAPSAPRSQGGADISHQSVPTTPGRSPVQAEVS